MKGYRKECDLFMNMKKKQKDSNCLKLKNESFRTIEVIILVLITFVVSLIIGLLIGRRLVKSNKTLIQDANLNNFIENYNYIVNNYYTEVDKEKIIDGAIEGMMSSLDDPYSMYFDSDESNSFNVMLDGEYKGLGIKYSQRVEDNKFIVVSVFENSPAEKCGLQVNDIIVSIDDKKLEGKELNELTNYINSNDKTFKMVISRDGVEKEIKISKAKINIESVQSKLYEKNNKKIGYIYISIFASNTYSQFKSKLDELEENKIDSLIIDVRQNTGGHLTSVEKILGDFLTKKQISFIIEDKGKNIKYYGKSKNNKKYNIVLLGDSISASASEVLISSLRDNVGAYFIGEKTYGKGSVQELITLSNDNQYKITTQRWLTPNSICVSDTSGIEPDKKVEQSTIYYETGKEEDDIQLQEAFNYLEKN